MKKIKKNGNDVKKISMLNNKKSKEITPLKIILDCDSEVRATKLSWNNEDRKILHCPTISLRKNYRKTEED